eukprot:3719771-Rhodomonas_salina.3
MRLAPCAIAMQSSVLAERTVLAMRCAVLTSVAYAICFTYECKLVVAVVVTAVRYKPTTW